MALTITTTPPVSLTAAANANRIAPGVRADTMMKGTKWVNAFITSTASTDYAQGGGQLQGIDIDSLGPRSMGINQIFNVFNPVVWVPAGVLGAVPDIRLLQVWWFWDFTRGRLRVVNATSEPNAVSAVYATVPIIIECIVMGV